MVSNISRIFALSEHLRLIDLPNREGFKFIGVCKDDTEMECYVWKDETGCHTVRDREGNRVFKQLKAWRMYEDNRYCNKWPD